MPVIPGAHAPTHVLPGTRFTTLVSPSTGSTEVSIWRVEIEPGTEPTPHQVTREEVFLVLSGQACLHLDGDMTFADPGDAVVVPAHTRFAITNAGDDVLAMLTCLPAGGQAQLPDGEPFTPPWAL